MTVIAEFFQTFKYWDHSENLKKRKLRRYRGTQSVVNQDYKFCETQRFSGLVVKKDFSEWTQDFWIEPILQHLNFLFCCPGNPTTAHQIDL
jgi:hypothetical protein